MGPVTSTCLPGFPTSSSTSATASAMRHPSRSGNCSSFSSAWSSIRSTMKLFRRWDFALWEACERKAGLLLKLFERIVGYPPGGPRIQLSDRLCPLHRHGSKMAVAFPDLPQGPVHRFLHEVALICGI